jgi:hypothetical protein
MKKVKELERRSIVCSKRIKKKKKNHEIKKKKKEKIKG